MQVTESEFAKQARDALASLYAPVALNAHPPDAEGTNGRTSLARLQAGHLDQCLALHISSPRCLALAMICSMLR